MRTVRLWWSRVTGLPRWAELGARIGVAMLIPVVVVGLLVAVVPRFTELPDGVALDVGGQMVSEKDVQQRIHALEALYGITQPPAGPELDRFERAMAKTVAMTLVLDRAAARRQVMVPAKDARDGLVRMVTQSFGADGRARFAKLLGEVGASEQDVLDELSRQQRTARLYQEVTKTVPPVTDADLTRAFEQRRAQLVVPEQRHLRNVVSTDRDDAEAVLQLARSGQDLGALAQQRSLDASTRDVGGDLGFTDRARLEDGFAAAAFAAPVGGLFGPVQTRFGWNVGQVLEVRPTVSLTFDQVKETLRGTLDSERRDATWKDWFDGQIHDADVRYADKYRPVDPPPAAPTDSGAAR